MFVGSIYSYHGAFTIKVVNSRRRNFKSCQNTTFASILEYTCADKKDVSVSTYSYGGHPRCSNQSVLTIS